MANSARNTPGSSAPVTEEAVVYDDFNPLDNVQVAYEKNKKMISTAAIVVVLAVVGYFFYNNMSKSEAQKAAAAMYWPQLYFQADSLNQALNGDGKNPGFTKVAKNFSGTPAGNLAHYYEGICYLRMGQFDKAITALQAFDGKGTTLSRQAAGALGLAYMESGKNDKAIENFKKAIADKDDVLVTPMYMYQLGMVYQAAGQTNEAKEIFKRLRDEYPRSQQARDMDKELANLGELN